MKILTKEEEAAHYRYESPATSSHEQPILITPQ